MLHVRNKQRVNDVLSKDVVCVGAEDSLGEALDLMVENRVNTLPVVDGPGRCIGIISASDLVSLTRDLHQELTAMETADVTHQWLIDQLDEHDLRRRRVKELMTESVASISPEASVPDAAREILLHGVHRLPVVGANNQLLGVVSTTDLLRALVKDA